MESGLAVHTHVMGQTGPRGAGSELASRGPAHLFSNFIVPILEEDPNKELFLQ